MTKCREIEFNSQCAGKLIGMERGAAQGIGYCVQYQAKMAIYATLNYIYRGDKRNMYVVQQSVCLNERMRKGTERGWGRNNYTH